MDQKSLLKELSFGLFFLLILLTLNYASGERGAITENPNEGREKYLYHAFPVGDNEDNKKELVEIELFGTGDDFEYVSRVVSPKSVETINLKMNIEGRFISGLRRVSNPQNQKLSDEEISRDENRVYIERDLNGRHKRKQIDLPRDKTLAVDGSLLILLRSFPFNTGKKWDIMMVDFSGYSVTVTVHQSKVENIVVQVGEFECYRMEVVVGLPILKPTLTYWLTTAKPHFLVKNIGKRGPFTSTYITSLVSKK
ncbi:MAG TPA: hypothetical protein VEM15_04365 [Thermodesulfobacteriota bacterium]|nr:hypothetical protein [Thermodesulfobacteriota bacterium]